MELTQLVDGVDFGEGPRWHDGRLWYSDFYQRTVYTVTTDGERTPVVTIDDRPSGLGWLPDGDLLIVAMTTQMVLRFDGSATHEHADLSAFAVDKCNDMVVAADGHAYVGNFGFDHENRAEVAGATIIHVAPDGAVRAAATDVAFPNGSVITPDGSTLIVGESYGQGYLAFDIEADHTLTNRRRWAETPGMAPDGCTMDADGAIWFSDAVGSQVVRVHEGGEITGRIPTPQPTFACMLGGDDGTTLFVLTAPSSSPDKVAGVGGGAIWTIGVDVAKAGLP